MSDMESLNKQEISFLKEQIERLERRVDAGFATITAKLEILIEGYVKKDEFTKHCDDAEKKYVTQAEFSPIKKITYGAVSLMLTILLGAVIYGVIIK
jgi:hypothetical protein